MFLGVEFRGMTLSEKLEQLWCLWLDYRPKIVTQGTLDRLQDDRDYQERCYRMAKQDNSKLHEKITEQQKRISELSSENFSLKVKTQYKPFTLSSFKDRKWKSIEEEKTHASK
jgi:hypothetical protein